MARIRTQTASGKPTTLREFLLRQDPAWLANELLRVADADPLVAARLKAAAGADRAGLVDLSGLLRELDTAILPGGYIEYGAAFGYASRIGRVLEQVEELTAEGFPDAAIEAAEHALRLLEEAFGQVDDSDGELGAVKARAQEIHLAACEAARPDPVRLGERLARWALRSDWEIFLEAPFTYADVLGQEGCSAMLINGSRIWRLTCTIGSAATDRLLISPGKGSPWTPAWARTKGCMSSPPLPVTGRNAAQRP